MRTKAKMGKVQAVYLNLFHERKIIKGRLTTNFQTYKIPKSKTPETPHDFLR